ncbi:hypothetical protein D3C78_1286260 [compost metagenome]
MQDQATGLGQRIHLLGDLVGTVMRAQNHFFDTGQRQLTQDHLQERRAVHSDQGFLGALRDTLQARPEAATQHVGAHQRSLRT